MAAAGEEPGVCRGLKGDKSADDNIRSDHGLSLSATLLLLPLLPRSVPPKPLDLSPLPAPAPPPPPAFPPTPTRGGGDAKLFADALLQLLGGTEEGGSKKRLDTQDSVLSRADRSTAEVSFLASAAATLSHCA